ncbi:hypothetical protein ERJ75_000475600 [Trypanosoma vivax]|nr:hypothetical protein ERJ75_000475600 [Trypanosoma vivax]
MKRSAATTFVLGTLAAAMLVGVDGQKIDTAGVGTLCNLARHLEAWTPGSEGEAAALEEAARAKGYLQKGLANMQSIARALAQAQEAIEEEEGQGKDGGEVDQAKAQGEVRGTIAAISTAMASSRLAAHGIRIAVAALASHDAMLFGTVAGQQKCVSDVGGANNAYSDVYALCEKGESTDSLDTASQQASALEFNGGTSASNGPADCTLASITTLLGEDATTSKTKCVCGPMMWMTKKGTSAWTTSTMQKGTVTNSAKIKSAVWEQVGEAVEQIDNWTQNEKQGEGKVQQDTVHDLKTLCSARRTNKPLTCDDTATEQLVARLNEITEEAKERAALRHATDTRTDTAAQAQTTKEAQGTQRDTAHNADGSLPTKTVSTEGTQRGATSGATTAQHTLAATIAFLRTAPGT